MPNISGFFLGPMFPKQYDIVARLKAEKRKRKVAIQNEFSLCCFCDCLPKIGYVVSVCNFILSKSVIMLSALG